MGEKHNSLQKQSGKNLTSLAHGGICLRGRDFKKRIKEILVTKKKSILKLGIIQFKAEGKRNHLRKAMANKEETDQLCSLSSSTPPPGPLD